MANIAGITGKQFIKGATLYDENKYQYATSSYEGEARMSPELVIYPESKDDISTAVKYANANKIAVAIRTGGHQYSGASSTAAPNIQLDLSKTFRGPDDRKVIQTPDGKTLIRTSISWSLGSFNKYLKENHVFVPHGQCTHVHLGGHVQTGGYGQLGRSFGLLGDHVIIIEIIDANGDAKEITQTSDSELFYALLGGSPGNLGIITHVTLEVHHDQDHEGALGMKILHLYNKPALKRLLDILVEMSDDDNFPRNFDLCVSVLSSSFKLLDLFPEVDGMMRLKHPEIFGKDEMPFWPRTIVVYAQYVPFGNGDPPHDFVMKWFSRIEQDSFFTLGVQKKPMSVMTGDWIFNNVREFNHPFVKRCYLTKSRTLGKDGWAQWAIDRIHALVGPDDNDCYLSAQLQCFGGKNSMFYRNRDNGTAYSWRDSSMCATLDAFYGRPAAKKTAEEWQRVNDAGMIGPNSKYSKQDRRLLWATYGDFDLDKTWKAYYEDKAKYDRIGKVRQAADPDGVFTPNIFAVRPA